MVYRIAINALGDAKDTSSVSNCHFFPRFYFIDFFFLITVKFIDRRGDYPLQKKKR